MIHMADLIMKRGDYSNFSIITRKNIFKAIYHFSGKIKVKYKTIIIDKKYTNDSTILRQKLSIEINKMINEHRNYFNKFEKFEYKRDFDHKEKRLFRVSDMLIYIDKYDYKYKNKMKFSNSEKFFFTKDEIRKILRELNKKRF